MNIETERCIITELKPNDFQEAVNLFTDESVRQYLGGTISEEVALKKLDTWLNKKDSLYFCVRISQSKVFVGIISITEYHNNNFKELSYQFLPEFWGMGIAEESIKTILQFLKNNTTIRELIAETQSKNIKSCRLLERLGFCVENKVIRFGEEQNIYKYIL